MDKDKDKDEVEDKLCKKYPILIIAFYGSPITSFYCSLTFMISEYEAFHLNNLKNYFFESYIIQGINFIFYFLLFTLMETGTLIRFFNWFKLKFCLRKNNFVFSEEQLPDEFLLYNNAKDQLLLNKDNDQPNKYQDIDKNNNNKISLNNNSNENIIKSSLYENNNQVNIKNEESTFYNNSLNQPLMQDGDIELINSNKVNDYDINFSINKVSLREDNLLAYGIRKSHPDINEEKYMLDTTNDFTTRIEGLYKTFWFCCKKNVRAIIIIFNLFFPQ